MDNPLTKDQIHEEDGKLKNAPPLMSRQESGKQAARRMLAERILLAHVAVKGLTDPLSARALVLQAYQIADWMAEGPPSE